MRRLAGLLALFLLARAASAQDPFEQHRAADLAGMTGVDPILLTLTEGKTTYRLGERIPLRLAFQPIGQVGLVRTDCGPGIGLDVVFDRPPGTHVPRSDHDLSRPYYVCGVLGGLYGGRVELPGFTDLDGRPLAPLLAPPVHEDVDLNAAIRIDAPGRYRFYVRTRHTVPEVSSTPPRLSNIVTIDVLERDSAWEASVIERAAQRLDAPQLSSARTDAVRELAWLGSDAAVDLLADRPDDAILALAWSARNRAHVVRRMVERLDDVSRPVDQAYVATLSAVEAVLLAADEPPARTEYERLQREYSARRLRTLAAAGQLDEHLAAAMREASDLGRVYPQPRIAWQSLAAGFAAVPGPVERALSRLTPALQRVVLEERLGWREFADPSFLPMFRRLAASRGADGPQDIAVAMWFLLAPDEARAFVWRELASAGTRLSAAGLLALPASPLPQFDGPMARRLEAATDPTTFDAAMSIVERFGSARIRRRVARAAERLAPAPSCAQSATTLAYFFRVDAAYARTLLARVEAAPDTYDDCQLRGPLATAAQRRTSPALEVAAVTRLADPRPWVVEDAAEMLRAHGSAAAEAALWLAFEQLRARWAQRVAEFSTFVAHTDDVEAALRMERVLSEALVGGTRWRFDAVDEDRRLALCVSADCRSGSWGGSFRTEPPSFHWNAPTLPHAELRAFAGLAFVEGMAAALAQVSLWPAGTILTWGPSYYDDPPGYYPTSLWLPGQEEALFEEVRRVIVAGGMTLTRD